MQTAVPVIPVKGGDRDEMTTAGKDEGGMRPRHCRGIGNRGGQSLNFGLGHMDVFAYVGGFSSAPNPQRAAQLIPDVDKVKIFLFPPFWGISLDEIGKNLAEKGSFLLHDS